MTPTVPASASESEDALLETLLSGVENARATVAAMQALEMTLLSAANAVAEERMARVGDRSAREREMPLRSLAADFAAALRVSDRTMQRQLGDAAAISARLPQSLAALGEARISRGHLRVIAEAAATIDDDAARASYESAVLPVAQRETPGRLRPVARRLAEKAANRTLRERHAEARRSRGVFVRDLDDGMAELSALLPALQAHGIHDRLTQMARIVRDAERSADDARADDARAAAEQSNSAPSGTNEDEQAAATSSSGLDRAETRSVRSMDELRADILMDLALTSVPSACADAGADMPGGLGAIRASVQVTVPVAALRGGDEAGHLTRSGPLDPETARSLAGAVDGWDRIFTDAVTGCVLAVDRYRPTEQMRRALRVRDEHCRFPGCRLAPQRCDIDHTVDHAHGGPTSVANLAHLCRRHHSLKHASAWTVRQREHGELEWTSPLGRLHRDVPERRVIFRASVDPPPF
jgi:hypothetical protein